MKRWYVLQVYAGYEESVKTDLTKRIAEQEVQGYFGEVLIPSAKLKHLFDSSASEDQQLFPGYVLIEMEITPETLRLVNNSPRVMKFLGGRDPIPLSQKEVDRILGQMRGEVVVASEQAELVTGTEIDIKEGPFAGFVGIVEKVDAENEKLTVMVSIFGRLTPVELNFDQIKQ